MNQNDIAKRVVHCCYFIHSTIGPGIFEKVYEEILYRELVKTGLRVDRQKEVPIIWDGMIVGIGFRADLIVEDLVLIEVKSVASIAAVHQKQVLTYLRLTNLKLGLLINFNESLLKDGISRIVNGL